MCNIRPRASRVDVKKLEKQEAKLKVCVHIYIVGMPFQLLCPPGEN